MHEMQTIVTDVCFVCLSVCHSTLLHFAKMAEQIKILFGVNTRGQNILFTLMGVQGTLC